MIKTVLRQDIFSTNKNITSLISELQKAMHDDDDNFDNEFTKTDYDAQFDNLGNENEEIEQYTCVIKFPHTSIDNYTAVLSGKIIHLLETYSVETLYIISDLKINILGTKKNNPKPLKDSLARFEKLTGVANTDEAFEVDLQDLAQCIETFFWLQWFDPSSPEFLYFVDAADRFAFTICNYGNIHLIEFKEELITNEFLEMEGWKIVEGTCTNQF